MLTPDQLPALITRHEKTSHGTLPEAQDALIAAAKDEGADIAPILAAALIFLAWIDGKLVGIGGIGGSVNGNEREGHPLPLGPFVLPAYRGRGIGTYLSGTLDQQIAAL